MKSSSELFHWVGSNFPTIGSYGTEVYYVASRFPFIQVREILINGATKVFL